MAQPKQPKGGRKDDGGNQNDLTPEEMAQLAEESPLTGLTSAFAEQDQRDAGEAADHSEDQAEEDEYFDDGEDDEVSQQEAPEKQDEAAEAQAAREGAGEKSAVEHVLGGGLASEPGTGTPMPPLVVNGPSPRSKPWPTRLFRRPRSYRDQGALKIGDIIIDDEFNGNIEDLLSKISRKTTIARTR